MRRNAEDGNTILQLSGGRWAPGALVNGDDSPISPAKMVILV